MSKGPTPLRTIMAAEGRRQSWLARKIGKHESEVSRIINRGLAPDAETKQAIAEALGRKVEELWPVPSEHSDSKAAA